MARGTDADVSLVATLEAVELACAAMEQFALGMGLLDPAAAATVAAFAAHHDQHAVAYRTARSATEPAVADQAVVDQLGPAILFAVDAPTLIAAVLAVERAVAATAIDAAGRLSSPDLASLAASVAPVEAQHATVLSTTLGLPAAITTPEVVLAEASVLDG